MKQIINILLGLILFFPFNGQAQQKIMPLDSVLSLIERNHPMLESFRHKLKSYDYQAEGKSSWMAPMAGLGTFMTPYPGQRIMNDADKGSVMLQLEQAIPNKSKQNAEKDYVLSLKKGVDVQKSIVWNEMRSYARELYIGWIMAEKKIALLEKNFPLLEMLKKIAEVRYPYNKSELGEIYKAEAEIEKNKNEILELNGEIAFARTQLNYLMNLPNDHDFMPDTSMVPVFQPLLADPLIIEESRKDVEMLRLNTLSMQKAIELKSLERKPEFSIRFDHMSPLGGMMPQGFSIMGMMSIPIAPWASKGYKSEIKSMQSQVLAMEKEKEGMINEAKGKISGLQQRIISSMGKIEGLSQKVIPAYRKSLDARMISYQEDNLPLSRVLESWKELQDMEMEWLNQQYNLFKMIIEYEKEYYK